MLLRPFVQTNRNNTNNPTEGSNEIVDGTNDLVQPETVLCDWLYVIITRGSLICCLMVILATVTTGKG